MDCEFQVMPPRGGIQGLFRGITWIASFKSCPREGASALIGDNALIVAVVSSHAPARGHPMVFNASFQSISFKSCPREGASEYKPELYRN